MSSFLLYILVTALNEPQKRKEIMPESTEKQKEKNIKGTKLNFTINLATKGNRK